MLKDLLVHETAVTDAGLAHLKGLRSLAVLNVKKTKVTAKGLAEFHAAVPGCKIEHDGGVIEAEKRRVGAQLNGAKREIHAATGSRRRQRPDGSSVRA